MPSQPSSRTPPDVVGRMLRRATVTCLAATLAAGAVAAVVAAPAAAASVVLAGVVATGSLAAGLAAVRWLLGQPSVVVLPGALIVLLVVVIVLAAVALVLREQQWVHRPAFAFSVLGAAVLFQAGLVQAYLSGPRPQLDVTLPGEEP